MTPSSRFSIAMIAVALLALPVPRLLAEVSLPAVFGDHMVLQQGQPIQVWGTADPGESVTVTFGSARGNARADAKGRWRVVLPEQAASAKPGEMVVKGKNEVKFTDVLLGDVWLAGGQSNMAWSLSKARSAKKAVPAANNPQLRLFEVDTAVAFEPAGDVRGAWKVCTPDSVKDFSAVGYFFGEMVQKERKIPVGIIDTNWGGTSAQAWAPRAALEPDPSLRHYVEQFDERVEKMDALIAKYDEQTLPAWKAKQAAWEQKEAPKGRQPRKPVSPDKDQKVPTVLYKAMIAPLVPYGITGAIWYQGEANSSTVESAEEYATLFPAMIKGWREAWGSGDFPFLFVQLAGYKTNREGWVGVREAQTNTLSLPKTGMAVTLDVGAENDIHPRNKFSVAERLYASARHVAYGEDAVWSGPMFESLKIVGGKAVVSFSHVGSGLALDAAPGSEKVDSLKGFEIAGDDGEFVEAEAEIKGDTVTVWSESVKQPEFVRYGWAPFMDVNLYNEEGLPAVPFSSR